MLLLYVAMSKYELKFRLARGSFEQAYSECTLCNFERHTGEILRTLACCWGELLIYVATLSANAVSRNYASRFYCAYRPSL